MKDPKQKDYPKLIAIGKATYHVILAEKLIDGCLGFCDSESKVIFISKDQDAEEMHATFWHEVLHAVAYEERITLNHPQIRKLEWAIARTAKQLYS